jgi:hypothetical protein
MERRQHMNYYADFDPYLIRERNEWLLREVRTLRLEKRLRKNRRGGALRLVSVASKSTLPVLRRANAQAEKRRNLCLEEG